MKDVLKYAAIVTVCATLVIIFISRFCGSAQTEHTVMVPLDSNFVPVVQETYRPPSTPFENPQSPVGRIPQGTNEKDVSRVIRVVKRGINTLADTTTILEMKTGEIFVPKQDSVQISVVETRYTPPILRWEIFASIGASFPAGPNIISPAIALSPLLIMGLVQFPLALVDLEAIGVGAGIQFRDFVFGVGSMWTFKDQRRQTRLFVAYSI